MTDQRIDAFVAGVSLAEVGKLYEQQDVRNEVAQQVVK